LGMLSMKWLMWAMKSFDNSSNGIAMYLRRWIKWNQFGPEPGLIFRT
jgi:hypothetical protein